jgi:hypothetical protein
LIHHNEEVVAGEGGTAGGTEGGTEGGTGGGVGDIEADGYGEERGAVDVVYGKLEAMWCTV